MQSSREAASACGTLYLQSVPNLDTFTFLSQLCTGEKGAGKIAPALSYKANPVHRLVKVCACAHYCPQNHITVSSNIWAGGMLGPVLSVQRFPQAAPWWYIASGLYPLGTLSYSTVTVHSFPTQHHLHSFAPVLKYIRTPHPPPPPRTWAAGDVAPSWRHHPL